MSQLLSIIVRSITRNQNPLQDSQLRCIILSQVTKFSIPTADRILINLTDLKDDDIIQFIIEENENDVASLKIAFDEIKAGDFDGALWEDLQSQDGSNAYVWDFDIQVLTFDEKQPSEQAGQEPDVEIENNEEEHDVHEEKQERGNEEREIVENVEPQDPEPIETQENLGAPERKDEVPTQPEENPFERNLHEESKTNNILVVDDELHLATSPEKEVSSIPKGQKILIEQNFTPDGLAQTPIQARDYPTEESSRNPFENSLKEEMESPRPKELYDKNVIQEEQKSESQDKNIALFSSPTKSRTEALLRDLEQKVSENIIQENERAELVSLINSLKLSLDQIVESKNSDAKNKSKRFIHSPKFGKSAEEDGGSPNDSPNKQRGFFNQNGREIQEILQDYSNIEKNAGSLENIDREQEAQKLYESFKSNFEENTEQFRSGIEFAQDVKESLRDKHITYINDQFIREIFAQMTRGKKKIIVCEVQAPLPVTGSEHIETDNKPYFKENCKQLMHYFQPFTKYLFLFNLEREFKIVHDKPKKIDLEIDFEISVHHKSVITPAGMIYIVSGRNEESFSGIDDYSGSCHVYHFDSQTLIPKTPMSVRRKQFGLCYMSKNLFVMGGFANGFITNSCERYDIRSNEWLEMATMPKKLREVSICAFNNRYIYRFFGINENNQIDRSIDRYDAVRDKWIPLKVQGYELLREIYMPLVVQANQDSILLFGGKTVFGYPSQYPRGHVLKIEDKRGSTKAEVVETNGFNPGFAGNFTQNNIICHNSSFLFVRESK